MSELKHFELGDNLTAEELKAEFFDSDALQVQPKPLYRLDHKKGRYYYEFGEDDKPIIYQSVTTLINRSLPQSEGLIKWKVEQGENAEVYTIDRQHYGTFMHTCIAELCINRTFNLDQVNSKIQDYIQKNNLPFTFANYADDIKQDLLAFVQWAIDYKVQPLAIEVVLAHPDGYAGALDFVCTMNQEAYIDMGEVYKSGPRKGETKLTKGTIRVKAIVDFKSGMKGFFESHKIQLHGYRNLWNHNFPEHEIEKVFNWSPKNWRTKPSYNFTEQTNEKVLEKFPHLLAIANIEDQTRDKSLTIYSGVISFDQLPTDNIINLSLVQAIERASEITKFDESEEEIKEDYERKD